MLALLAEKGRKEVKKQLGRVVEQDIKSLVGPFRTLPDYRTTYPDTVIQALRELYVEYNLAFAPLVAKNREWDTDYQYCFLDGAPVNWAVQIDMLGLDDGFLQRAERMPVEELLEILRPQIFEIENSIAMYQLLERIFKIGFRRVLDDLRERYGRPIALLAVTDEKYDAMKESEFGKTGDEQLSDEEVFELSGFDRFFGPSEFQLYVEENRGECEYLLYARTSEPIRKLKNPKFHVEHPLLGKEGMRRIIKAHALTFNIDAPDMEYHRRINDTKEYMPPMGMAFQVSATEDLRSPQFEAFLRKRGFDEPQKALLRCKPAKGTYGCYGHVARITREGRGSGALAKGLTQWGDYVVQPELSTPVIINETDGIAYTFIDRNFFGMVNGCPEFLGGFRNLMAVDSFEARRGRIHGNSSAVYAEIAC